MTGSQRLDGTAETNHATPDQLAVQTAAIDQQVGDGLADDVLQMLAGRPLIGR